MSSGLVAGSAAPIPLGSSSSAYLHNLAKALLLRLGHRSKTLEIVAWDTPESFAIDTCDAPFAPNTSLNWSHLRLRAPLIRAIITEYLHKH